MKYLVNEKTKQIFNGNIPRYDNAGKYSTEEIKVGKWVDGKDVYRKVFNITSPSSSSETAVVSGLTYIESLVKMEGYIQVYNGAMPINFYYNANTQIATYYIYPGKVKMIIPTVGYQNKPGVLILEYTKKD